MPVRCVARQLESPGITATRIPYTGITPTEISRLTISLYYAVNVMLRLTAQ
jgi:hypothetical protein